MEGDIKDIVLTRLEKRLKDKDEEVRALKERLRGFEDSDRIAALEKNVERLEDEVREAQAILSEVMKKVGSLEAALTSLIAANCEDGECEDMADPDLLLDGQSEPAPQQAYDIGVAAKGDDPAGDKKDALSFFHVGKNS
jgi:predicted nuclease with TOPRIM domain